MKKNIYFFDLDDTILLVDGPPHKNGACKPNLPVQAFYQTVAMDKNSEVYILTGRHERLRELTESQICRITYFGLYMNQRGEDGTTPPGHVFKSNFIREFVEINRGKYNHFYIVDNDPEACVLYNQIPEVCVLNFWPKMT